MDEGKVEMVLGRIMELRFKITNCISYGRKEGRYLGKGSTGMDLEEVEAEEEDDKEEEDEETYCLLSIREAIENLEVQVSSLQALHQQHVYEKAEALAGIAHSQDKLLKKLKEYKGDNMGIIEEAIAFVGDTAEESSNDLLLPPYPTRPYSSSPVTVSQNGVISGARTEQSAKHACGSSQQEAKGASGRVTCFLGAAARVALTVAGVISALTLAGFEIRLMKRRNCPNITNLQLQLLGVGKKRDKAECPPGKVLVFENGESRCLVRERVEMPFHSDVATPDVSYGCG
ncbi:unnamed protein product [Cuscuta epithymum]|uniref:Plastid division protein PDV2 n=1 Tax=Cuscuta epithymum TaxID=186058 RepID=A0AAV0ENX3_9ASTE|nr:unnamed protein product [Cuscuta epithymum]